MRGSELMYILPEDEGRLMEMRRLRRGKYVEYQMLIWRVSDAFRKDRLDEDFVECMRGLKEIEDEWLSKRYFSKKFYDKLKLKLKRDKGR